MLWKNDQDRLEVFIGHPRVEKTPMFPGHHEIIGQICQITGDSDTNGIE